MIEVYDNWRLEIFNLGSSNPIIESYHNVAQDMAALCQ